MSTGPATFSDLVSAVVTDQASIASDQSDISAAQSALNLASSKLASDQNTLASDQAAIGAAVANNPRFVINPNGTASFYVSSPNPPGYTIVLALPADDPL